MRALLKTGRVLACAGVAAALLFVGTGCGEKQRAETSSPMLASGARQAQASPAAPVAAAPASRLHIRGPMSQAQLDAIYNSPALTSQSGSLRLATPVPSPVENIPNYAVQAEPNWNVSITREWRHIVVHHSASSMGSASIFDREHKERGWDGVGYHFVIGNGSATGDGQVEPTYRWRQQMQGAHAGVPEYNLHGIGICLVGDFETGPGPSARQMASLRALVRFLQVKTGVPTSEVVGHGDVKATSCPGRMLSLSAFRASLGGGDRAIDVPINYVSQSAAPAPVTSRSNRSYTARSGAALP